MQNWLENLIFYEIYPNSFKDSNGDGYGDFQGIISKLDYVKGLGVNAIWLNPHYDSPFMDGGYDVRDFFHASSRFGTDEDFARLIEECHKRDIKLIVDLVAGHTSEENEIFLKSACPFENEYSDMFIWTKSPWDLPTGYRFLSGRFQRSGTYMVNFFSTQPALNYGFKDINYPEWQISYKDPRVAKTRRYMESVALHYLRLGVDGFRVDMADSLVKNDDNKEATIEVWQDMFAHIRSEFPNAIFVSEWCNLDASLKAGFDIDFALDHWYTFYNALARVEERGKGEKSFLRSDSEYDITAELKAFEEKVKANKDKGYVGFISCNHDTPRPSRYLDDKELRLFYTVLFTMPGVPFLYYGDEIKMIYQEDLASVECGFARTGSRTPMAFDDTKNKGFSTANKEALFLPIDPFASVKMMQEDKNSLYYFILDLIKIRKENKGLQGNDFNVIYSKDKRLLMYKRNDFLVVINPNTKAKEVDVEEGKVIFASGDCKVAKNKLEIGAQECAIYKINRK